MTGKSILKLIGCIALPLVVGGISGFVTAQQISGWYATLNKPSFNPPNYLFGPVWTSLYILMGVSLYLVLNTPAVKQRTAGIIIFSIQHFLNFWWSIIFFSLHQPGFAFIEIVLLWVSIITMIVTFFRIKPIAAYLQVPYLLWVSFASALNYGIWMLNKA